MAAVSRTVIPVGFASTLHCRATMSMQLVRIAERKFKTIIPGRSNRCVKIKHDRTLYKQRNRIDRMFGHLQINHATATRYNQLVNSFLGSEAMAPLLDTRP